MIARKDNIQDKHEEEKDNDDEEDTDSDLELIEECDDRISETESESEWVPEDESECSD